MEDITTLRATLDVYTDSLDIIPVHQNCTNGVFTIHQRDLIFDTTDNVITPVCQFQNAGKYTTHFNLYPIVFIMTPVIK